jgi:hypothetical protein
MRDLTFANYRILLESILCSNRKAGGVEDFLDGKLGLDAAVVIRHDVDRRSNKAVVMANLEREFGIRTTYYFRTGRKGFPEKAIRKIVSLGHHVGYHYETLAKCRGNMEAALRLFQQRLEALRSITECRTVCMHGSPLSKYNNLDLMRSNRWKEFGLLGEAILSFKKFNIIYLTDTGGGWGFYGSHNLRDRLPKSGEKAANMPRSTSDLLYLLERDGVPIYLNIHPERWATGWWDGIWCGLIDSISNAIKYTLSRNRDDLDGAELPQPKDKQV